MKIISGTLKNVSNLTVCFFMYKIAKYPAKSKFVIAY